jgi:hypothetical protein
MLPALLLYKGAWRIPVVLLPCIYLFFYGSFGWVEGHGSFAQTIVAAPRFFLPALPFFIISYAYAGSGLLNKIPRLERPVLLAVIVIALTATGYLFCQHRKLQDQYALARDTLYENTGENSLLICTIEESKLVQTRWGPRKVLDIADATPEAVASAAETAKAIHFIFLDKADTMLARMSKSAWKKLSVERRLRHEEKRIPVGNWALVIRTLHLNNGDKDIL